MSDLLARRRTLLDGALAALETRGFWTPFPEVPSGKIYGETARADGLAAYEARLGQPFPARRPPRIAPGRRRGLALRPRLGNPAGNASLTDAAFVANRFRRAMWRRPKAA